MMHSIDWLIVFTYCVISLVLGVVLTRKASEGLESYFVSNHKLGWWLAGTSMAATSFSSDTPLLITGIVRQRGIWGNWEVWGLAISTMLAVFFFSKLWKRAGVMTEVEFVEKRYSGKPAAFLRGFKALYWGFFYNIFIMGAWPMTGLVKIMQETTHWSKPQALFFAMGLTTVYCSLSGYWGVILTDFFQFIIAMTGAILLAIYAVKAAGGLEHITAVLQPTGKLAIFPPVSGSTPYEFLASPFGWFLGIICIQWWAWKNTDGGGVIVQRMSSCKDERQAALATLWFNIAQNALRAWPWILTALASLILLPDLTDHERAYPRLAMSLLPTGWRGLMVASFFAAFMSTMSTQLNWGSSYFVSDFYKRFIARDKPESHYLIVARILPVILAAGAMGVAFFTDSIGHMFTFVLNLTAGVGPVFLLRWFWWRINPWSEITALAISVPVILVRAPVLHAAGIPDNLPVNLLFMILGSALFWLPVTLMTPPANKKTLDEFYRRVAPPGFWRRPGKVNREWRKDLKLWAVATAALFATTLGPLKWMLGSPALGIGLCVFAALLWIYVGRNLHFAPSKRVLAMVLVAALTFCSPAGAAYNPAKDNPYVRPAGSFSKKWYEFYKKEKHSAYIQKPSGYWRSAKEDNILVRGAKALKSML